MTPSAFLWRTLATDAVAFSLLIAGAFYGVGWAGNITIFMTWFALTVRVLTGVLPGCTTAVAKSNLSKPHLAFFYTHPVAVWYDRITDTLSIGLLVSAGWFTTAAAYLLSVLLKEVLRAEICTLQLAANHNTGVTQ